MIFKNKIKIFVTLFFIIFSLAVGFVILPLTVNAAGDSNKSTAVPESGEWSSYNTILLQNSKERIDNAAYYKSIGDFMHKCVRNVVGYDDAEKSITIPETIFGLNTKTYKIGPWLQDLITGKIDSGEVQCKEGKGDGEGNNGQDGILNEFAAVVFSNPKGDNKGGTVYKDSSSRWWTYIVCNAYDRTYPGLMARKEGAKTGESTGCNGVFDNYEPSFYTQNIQNKVGGEIGYNKDGSTGNGAETYSTGEGYMRVLWDHWRTNEEYYQVGFTKPNEHIPIWNNLENWTNNNAFWHYRYRKDFDAFCNVKYDVSSDQAGMALWYVDPKTGAMKKQYVGYDGSKHTKGTTDRVYVEGPYGGSLNCEGLANAVNKTFDPYYKAIRDDFKADCNSNEEIKKAWKFSYTKARLITGDDADSKKAVLLSPDNKKYYTDNLPSQETIDKWGDKAWRNYTESTGEDGKTTYKIKKFSEDDIKKAKQTIKDYKTYNANGKQDYFKEIHDDKMDSEEHKYPGYTCAVPVDTKLASEEEAKSSDSETTDGDSDPCYDAGVEGMSWVLCPTINNAATTIDGFESTLKTMLSIESNKLFGSDTESYKIWETFRNIANVILIIIFLAIIFSQLTGYGIDNYGIKKMLPKLIVMAILINLSYILCEIAVDLSNILGVGLNNLFEGMAGDAASQNSTYQIVTALLAAAAGITTGVVIVFQLISEGGGAMVVVTLVLAVLSALVVIFMFLVMVGLRMIIVVVFTVISPVAFALYILPNTQSLFKKWWKVFEAALVVYPICGALYGAHFIIKAIILGQTGEGGINFFMGIAAVIAPFLPFVALPSLLKGALAGLGAVAGAVTAIGSGIRKGANRAGSAVKNTKAFKGMQERGAERSAERRATRIRNRLQNAANRRGGINNLSNSQRRRLYQANTLLNEQEKQRIQDSVGATPLDADATRTRLENEREQQMARDSIGVLRITPEMARRRAQAERSSQEFKAAQEQYSNYTRDQLLEEAGFRRDASGRLTVGGASRIDINQPGGSERMRALLSTMEANGMEHDIATTLQNNDVSNDAGIMSTLNGFNNKVLKAYGKRGAGQSYDQFMQGTGDNSMQGYIKSKDADFVNGLDDKALEQIASYNGGDAINDDVLNRAVIDLKGDAREQAKNIMINRLKNGNFSTKGENLAGYSDDVFAEIAKYSNGRQAIVAASDSLSAEQVKKLGQVRRQYINQQRQASGKAPI